ncbi:TRAP transporter substrate-binding protein DctP [Desulfovibrio sp. OttesenSCG-928-C14]|nr:TRAP transporter substrate-binding protein DctP [Desulfovibrio sp. OttesenSCG-928-C14]
MKKTALLLTVAFVCLFAGPARAATELSLTTIYVDRHPVVQKIYVPWMEEIKRRTGGEVVIKYYNPGTICPEGEMYASLLSGSVDIASTQTSRTSGAMPLNNIMEVPFLFKSAEAASASMYKMAMKYPAMRDEYKGMRLLTTHTSAIIQIHTTKKPIKSMADLKGQKIASSTPFGRDIMRALGANGQHIPFTDTYMALSRGMADGSFLAFAPLRSLKVNEVLKHSYVCNASVAGMFVGMSEQAWAKLTPEQQQIFRETTGEVLARKLGKLLDDSANADRDSLAKEGLSVVFASDAEMAKMRKATTKLTTDWVKSVEKRKNIKGVQAMLDDLRKTADDLYIQYEAEAQ